MIGKALLGFSAISAALADSDLFGCNDFESCKPEWEGEYEYYVSGPDYHNHLIARSAELANYAYYTIYYCNTQKYNALSPVECISEQPFFKDVFQTEVTTNLGLSDVSGFELQMYNGTIHENQMWSIETEEYMPYGLVGVTTMPAGYEDSTFDTDRKIGHIVFRGSSNNGDWAANYDYGVLDDGIYQGFAKRARIYRDHVFGLLVGLRQKYPEMQDVIFSGHSLGGADSTIALSSINRMCNGSNGPVVEGCEDLEGLVYHNINFASPIPGTPDFAEESRGYITYYRRVLMTGDHVPHVPGSITGTWLNYLQTELVDVGGNFKAWKHIGDGLVLVEDGLRWINRHYRFKRYNIAISSWLGGGQQPIEWIGNIINAKIDAKLYAGGSVHSMLNYARRTFEALFGESPNNLVEMMGYNDVEDENDSLLVHRDLLEDAVNNDYFHYL